MFKQTIKTSPDAVRGNVSAIIVHKITELYKKLYKISQKIPKRDKFGIFLKTENACLETLNLTIRAAFNPRSEKAKFIIQMRIVVEFLKNLTRISLELEIIEKNTYFNLQKDLQEISKMSWGWLEYLQNNKEGA